MADRKFSTAQTIALAQDALSSALMVIHSGSNKLLPASLLLSLLTKVSLQLDQVNNTSDSDKPVSTATATAIQTLSTTITEYIDDELSMTSPSFDGLTAGNAIDVLDIRMTNFESSQGSNDSIQYQQLMDTMNALSLQITELSTPEMVMPIALAKIDSVFAEGPAFSMPICFNDMVILDIDFSLGEPAYTGNTVLDLFYTFSGTTTSILSAPLVIPAGDNVCVTPITSLIGGSELLSSAAGTRLSGTFTSVGTGAKSPVLTLKWKKQ